MLDHIIKLIKGKRNILITGGGGVGKSYIINQLKEKFQKDLVITSTTGLSAIPFKGMTIHKWSGIGIIQGVGDLSDEQIREIAYFRSSQRIKHCKKLVIEEISMFKAGQFDLLNLFCKIGKGNEKPFGGIQMILVGDFLQLPPVDTEDRDKLFVFQSESFKEANFEIVHLTEVKRQKDEKFINILNQLRFGHLTNESISELRPKELKNPVVLCAKNSAVDNINMKKLAECKGKDMLIDGVLMGTNNHEMRNLLDSVLTPLKLHLRVGCQVMVTVNERTYDNDSDSIKEQGYVNGTMGTFLGIETRESTRFKYKENKKDVLTWENNEPYLTNVYAGEKILINEAVVKTTDNRIIYIPRNKWTYGISHLNMKTKEVEYEALFIQYPLRLGYAVTIHKSQGMTLDEVEVDCDGIFCAGQLYVALSRARTLEGLSVKNLKSIHSIVDHRAIDFYKELQ